MIHWQSRRDACGTACARPRATRHADECEQPGLVLTLRPSTARTWTYPTSTLQTASCLDIVLAHSRVRAKPPTNAAASVAAGAAQPLPANALVLVRRLMAKPEHNGKRTCALSFDATGRRPGPACLGGSACSDQMEPSELGALGPGEPQAQAAASSRSRGRDGCCPRPLRGTHWQAASHSGCHSARAQTNLNTHAHTRVRAAARASSGLTCWHALGYARTHTRARALLQLSPGLRDSVGDRRQDAWQSTRPMQTCHHGEKSSEELSVVTQKKESGFGFSRAWGRLRVLLSQLLCCLHAVIRGFRRYRHAAASPLIRRPVRLRLGPL